jgi:glutamyl-tRNA synthetase
MEYARQDYLPEAMVNFLALLGWSPGTDQEIFTVAELIDTFDLSGISGGNAVFNPEKLDWVNAQHIARMTPSEILARIRPLLERAGVWRDELVSIDSEWIARVIALVKPRAKKLADFVPQLEPFLRDRVTYDPAAVEKHLGSEDLLAHMEALRYALDTLASFDESSTESTLRDVARARGVKAGPLIHATRVAVTGAAVSPGLFEVLALLGRSRVIARIGELERFLRARVA